MENSKGPLTYKSEAIKLEPELLIATEQSGGEGEEGEGKIAAKLLSFFWPQCIYQRVFVLLIYIPEDWGLAWKKTE